MFSQMSDYGGMFPLQLNSNTHINDTSEQAHTKMSILARRNFFRLSIMSSVVAAVAYSSLSITDRFTQKEFHHTQQLLDAIAKALNTKIDWEYMNVEEVLQINDLAVQKEVQSAPCHCISENLNGVLITRKVKHEHEIEKEKAEAWRWVCEEFLQWAANFQSENAKEADCNDHALLTGSALCAAGIPALYVSIEPALKQDGFKSKHQIVVVKLSDHKFVVLDCNKEPTLVTGDLDKYLLTYTTPMKRIGIIGIAEVRESYFKNPLARATVLLNNRTDFKSAPCAVNRDTKHYDQLVQQ